MLFLKGEQEGCHTWEDQGSGFGVLGQGVDGGKESRSYCIIQVLGFMVRGTSFREWVFSQENWGHYIGFYGS